jgi:hypothetical protein
VKTMGAFPSGSQAGVDETRSKRKPIVLLDLS